MRLISITLYFLRLIVSENNKPMHMCDNIEFLNNIKRFLKYI